MTAIKHRDSSLELYRIIVMLAIVAHHYVVCSGVLSCFPQVGWNANDFFLRCFGAWGKIGVNCFVLITGYFMCTSSITFKKLLKLYLEIVFYSIVLNSVFVLTGYTPVTRKMILYSLFPVEGITTNYFWGAFIVFFLTIPFLNILVNHMTQRQHILLLALLVPVFTILPFFPGIRFAYNHVEWFAILYFISSYLRKYPNRITENRCLWGFLSVAGIICGIASIYCMGIVVPRMTGLDFGATYWLVDSNKFTAIVVSLAFFLAFKPSQKISNNSAVNLNIQPQHLFYSPLINTIASATFGVLLIHANSDAMRRWLWHDVCDVVGNYERCAQLSASTFHLSIHLVAHAFGCVLAVFAVCVILDLLRQRCIERPFFSLLFTSNNISSTTPIHE